MARIAPRSDTTSELDVFTDRAAYVEAFLEQVRHGAPEDNCVLVFCGDGGIGKSALVRKLRASLSGSHLVGTLDFAHALNTEPDYALFRLKESLSPVPFPTFSIAAAAYSRIVHPESQFVTNRRLFLEAAGPYTDVLEVVLDTPGLSIPLKSLKAAAQGTQLLRDWYTKRAEPLLTGLSELDPRQILERLPALWASDLNAYLSKASSPAAFFGQPLANVAAPVIFLDSYEKLWRHSLGREGIDRTSRERWLVDLVGRLPKVVWVVSGRDRLTWWEFDDPEWKACLHQHVVGRLSDEDSHLFLAKRGIDDEGIADAIVRSSSGVPFYLELQAQQYDRMPPDQRVAAMFGGTHSEVVERMLSYLDASESATMREMSLFSEWDASLFAGVVEHSRTGYPAGEATRFGRLWSIEEVSTGVWRMRGELRDHLEREIRETDFDRFLSANHFAWTYFVEAMRSLVGRQTTRDVERILPRALEHAAAARETGEAVSEIRRCLNPWFSDAAVRGIEAICVGCKAKRHMVCTEKITMKNGRPATRGLCPHCFTKMFKIGA